MITAIRKVVTTFKLGEEFIEDRPDGVKVLLSIFIVPNYNLYTTVK